jgi:REP element-mobilizing transposase RayT
MPHGTPPRCPGRDYSEPGWYFITIVTAGRRRIFGRIEDGVNVPSSLGNIVTDSYTATLGFRPWITSAAFALMPDHVHALVGWTSVPENRRDVTLGQMVSQFKGIATREARRQKRLPPWEAMWQEGFHDVVIRSRRQLRSVYCYIIGNPIVADIAAPQAAGPHDSPQ